MMQGSQGLQRRRFKPPTGSIYTSSNAAESGEAIERRVANYTVTSRQPAAKYDINRNQNDEAMYSSNDARIREPHEGHQMK